MGAYTISGSTLGLVVATTAVEATVVTGRALGGLVNTNGASIEPICVICWCFRDERDGSKEYRLDTQVQTTV